jgi:hypothetical protein
VAEHLAGHRVDDAVDRRARARFWSRDGRWSSIVTHATSGVYLNLGLDDAVDRRARARFWSRDGRWSSIVTHATSGVYLTLGLDPGVGGDRPGSASDNLSASRNARSVSGVGSGRVGCRTVRVVRSRHCLSLLSAWRYFSVGLTVAWPSQRAMVQMSTFSPRAALRWCASACARGDPLGAERRAGAGCRRDVSERLNRDGR